MAPTPPPELQILSSLTKERPKPPQQRRARTKQKVIKREREEERRGEREGWMGMWREGMREGRGRGDGGWKKRGGY